MIVHKEKKTYQTRSDKPNENWTNDSNYLVVDDNSLIAKKIREYYPFYTLVIKNDEIVDVIEDTKSKEKFDDSTMKLQEIEELKQKLKDTDYQAIKYAEGQISDEEYTPIKAERKSWRDRINELEADLEV